MTSSLLRYQKNNTEEKVFIVTISGILVRIYEYHDSKLKIVCQLRGAYYKYGYAISFQHRKRDVFLYNSQIFMSRDKNEASYIINIISARLEEILWKEELDIICFIAAPVIGNILARSLSFPVKGRVFFLPRPDLIFCHTKALESELGSILDKHKG